MTRHDREHLVALDKAHVWHPFTQMQTWLEPLPGDEPLIIDHARGSWLFDTRGRKYLDAISSLWVNVHGHHRAEIDSAIRLQLERVAHTTLLGLASPPSIELAAELVARAPRQGLAPGEQTAERRGQSCKAGGADMRNEARSRHLRRLARETRFPLIVGKVRREHGLPELAGDEAHGRKCWLKRITDVQGRKLCPLNRLAARL